MILIRSFLNRDYRLPGPGGKGWYQDLKVIGTGASCVVYRAVFVDDSANDLTTDHLLKEYNPKRPHTERRPDGCLVPAPYAREDYNAGLQRFRNGYICQQKIRRVADLTNSTSNIQRVFDANGTAYIDMTVMNGQTYTQVKEPDLYQLLRRMKTLTEVIGNYHKAGYLHLDIKPDNIFVYPETPEMLLLFDFDSVVPKDGTAASTGLSYTKDWAAPEQRTSSQQKWICEATDLYSVGEIIFTRLFGRHSDLEDRRSFASFDYDLDSPFLRTVNPRLFPLLTELLHKTLCSVPKKRYQHAEELLDQLDRMLPLADPKRAFVRTNATYQSACFYGREDLLGEIDAFFCGQARDKGNALFLSGVGGIGKTELARRYAYLHEKEYDRILFLPFRNSMKDTLCQEVLKVYHGNQPESETDFGSNPDEEYAYILGVLKEDLTPRDLLILDNFDVLDKQIQDILSINCKILVTTRMDVADYDYPQRTVEAIGETDTLWAIFRKYNQRDYSEEECAKVEALMDHVDRHTMTICLISKYLRVSGCAPSELLETLMTREGITATQESTHVKHRKDCCPSDESVQKHLRILFDLSRFSQNEIDFMAALSLFGPVYIKKKQLQTMLGSLYQEETLQGLAKNGWVEVSGDNAISLHQIILDLAYNTLVPECTSLEPVVEGMIKYAREDIGIETLRKMKYRYIKIFLERLTGHLDKMREGEVTAAELYFDCCKLGGYEEDEPALAKAEQLCSGLSTQKGLAMRFQIELEWIRRAGIPYRWVIYETLEEKENDRPKRYDSIFDHEMKAWRLIFSPEAERPGECPDAAEYSGQLDAPDASVCDEEDEADLAAFLARVPFLPDPADVRTDQIEKLIRLARAMDQAGSWFNDSEKDGKRYLIYLDEECILRYAYRLAATTRQDKELQKRLAKELADFHWESGGRFLSRDSFFADSIKKAFYTLQQGQIWELTFPGTGGRIKIDSYLDAADYEEKKGNYAKAIEALMRALDAQEAPKETIVLRMARDEIQLCRSEGKLQEACDRLLAYRAYEQRHGFSDMNTLLSLAEVCEQMDKTEECAGWYDTLIQEHRAHYEALDQNDRIRVLFSYCKRAELDERYPIDDALGRWMAERLTELDIRKDVDLRLLLVCQKLFDPLKKLVGFQDAARLVINAADKFSSSFHKAEAEAEALYLLVCERCKENQELDLCFSAALKGVNLYSRSGPLPNRSWFLALLEELSQKPEQISELNMDRYHYALYKMRGGDPKIAEIHRRKCNFYRIAEYDAAQCDSVSFAVGLWNGMASEYEGICDYENALRCYDQVEKLVGNPEDFKKMCALGTNYQNRLRIEYEKKDVAGTHACIEKMYGLWCRLAERGIAVEAQIRSWMWETVNEMVPQHDAVPTVLIDLIGIRRMISGSNFYLPADLSIFDERAARAQIAQLLTAPLEVHSDASLTDVLLADAYLDEAYETIDLIDPLYRSAFPENIAAWRKFQKACGLYELEEKHEQ